MDKYLANYYDLFSEDDQVMYRAILAKKDWMMKPLFLKGDVAVSYDQEGKAHYRILEALMDQVLPFAPYRVTRPGVPSAVASAIEAKLAPYAVLYLEENVDFTDGTPFVIAYDLRLLDARGYHALVANFYPCRSPEALELSLESVPEGLLGLLKWPMVGPSGRDVLIMDQQTLLNGNFYAPVTQKIIVGPAASDLLKTQLRQIAREKGIIYEEATL